jgi:SAM-dependent methyltransferase
MANYVDRYYIESAAADEFIKGRQFRHIVAYLAIFRNKRVRFLDVGCAAGHLVKQAQEFDIEAYGIELSRYALRQKVTNSLVQAEAQHLPFREGSFDVVSLLEVVEHLPDPKQALDDVYRVLKNNGLLIFSSPSEKGKPFRNVKGGYIDSTHINERTPTSWIRLLKEIGFRCKPYYLPFVFSEYDFSIFPSSIPIFSRLKPIFSPFFNFYKLLPVPVRFYLEEPLRHLVGVYFSRKLNSFYLVAYR